MEEAKHREKSDGNTSIDEHETTIKSSEIPQKDQHSSRQLTSVNPQSSLLSLLARKHWGVLGELRYQAEQYVESHQLSLYHESTPWKRYLRRNRAALTVAAGLMVVISFGFFFLSLLFFILFSELFILSSFLHKSHHNYDPALFIVFSGVIISINCSASFASFCLSVFDNVFLKNVK